MVENNYNSIQYEINKIWTELAEEFSTDLKKKNLSKIVKDSEKKCENDIKSLIPILLEIFNEFTLYLYVLQSFCNNLIKENVSKNCISYFLLVTKLCQLYFAMRKLIITGLEDPLRCLFRSFIETMEIALAIIDDEELGKEYMSENITYSSKKFWENKVAYGKINEPIKKTLIRANYNSEEIERFMNIKSDSKKVLSNSLHSSIGSVLQVYATPSLKYPGQHL
jgi:hypothetical protein